MKKGIRRGQAAIVVLAILTLLAAMWAGLLRIGLSLPPLTPTLSPGHGPLMVSGFLGTLVGMERATALGHRWMYLAPGLSALGALLIILPVPGWAGALSITASSLVLVLLFIYISRRQRELFNYVLTLGAVIWLVGNLFWLGGMPIPSLVPWWAGYLILTIGGERLELTRLLQISQTGKAVFLAAVLLFLSGLVLMPFDYTLGWRVTGAGMVALALWLFRHDMAWRTIRTQGLTQYIAACMISGYVWLMIGGAMALAYGFLYGGTYDAVLHAVFLGFVMSMIFGHAPVIFPAVLGVTMQYTPRFYAHLGLLHLSLALRVAGGVAAILPWRQWAIVLNVIAVLLFLGNTASSVRWNPVRLPVR